MISEVELEDPLHGVIIIFFTIFIIISKIYTGAASSPPYIDMSVPKKQLPKKPAKERLTQVPSFPAYQTIESELSRSWVGSPERRSLLYECDTAYVCIIYK